MKQHFAAKLTLSALTILLAIAPVPFEKWAWQRIGFGLLGLVGITSTKSKIDEETEEQRVLDIYEFGQKQHDKEFVGMQQGLALEAARQQEAVRFGLQTKVMAADYQGAFVTLMEEKHPYYLDALEAQQKAALQAQERAYSTEGGTAARVGESMEIGAILSDGCANGSETDPQLLAIRAANPNLDFYDFNDLKDDAVGILVAGNSGSGKTSIAGWIAGKLTEHNPAQVFALDPHFNDIWEQLGIHALGEFHEIEEALDLLVEELDARRTRKKNKQPLGDTILCFTDELNGCIGTTSDPKKYKMALQRLGSEGRKFGIMLIGLCQSSNVDDLEISGPMRSNYLMVCVGETARYQCRQQWKQDDPRRQWLAKQAYPCVVTGCVNLQLALHPTHNAYTTYKKNGNAPQNMGIVTQLPLTFLPLHLSPNTSIGTAKTEQNSEAKSIPIAHVEAQRQQLDNLYKGSSIVNQLQNNMTPEEIDELIKGLRNGVDTSGDTPDSFLMPKTALKTNQAPELAPDKDSRRIWDVSDFRKNLPDRQEEVMFGELDAYFKETSRSPSEIIKRAWKLSNGEVYGSIGKPCFVYLVTKYGDDELKNSSKVAKLISEYLASVDDAEEG